MGKTGLSLISIGLGVALCAAPISLCGYFNLKKSVEKKREKKSKKKKSKKSRLKKRPASMAVIPKLVDLEQQEQVPPVQKAQSADAIREKEQQPLSPDILQALCDVQRRSPKYRCISDRLVFREYTQEDLNFILELLLNSKVAEFFYGLHFEDTEQKFLSTWAAQFIKSLDVRERVVKHGEFFVCLERTFRAPIGFFEYHEIECDVKALQGKMVFSVSGAVLPTVWKSGYGKEILKTALKTIFSDYKNIGGVVLRINIKNKAATALACSCGFEFEAIKRIQLINGVHKPFLEGVYFMTRARYDLIYKPFV